MEGKSDLCSVLLEAFPGLTSRLVYIFISYILSLFA